MKCRYFSMMSFIITDINLVWYRFYVTCKAQRFKECLSAITICDLIWVPPSSMFAAVIGWTAKFFIKSPRLLLIRSYNAVWCIPLWKISQLFLYESLRFLKAGRNESCLFREKNNSVYSGKKWIVICSWKKWILLIQGRKV
jgi:hypothetical protein